MKLSCIAVDDEALALNKISRFVEKIEFLNLTGTFDNAIDALHFIRENHVDLMFLDVQMEDLTGIQLLKTMKNPPMVILTTAFESYALEGYEHDIIDYLLKPIQFDRFLKACDKALDKYLRFHASASKPQEVGNKSREKFIFFKSGSKIYKVNLNEILYIEGLKDYLLIHTNKTRIITLQTFNGVMDLLPPEKFLRVHKSYIIAIDHIERVEGNMISIGNKTIPIGATYKNSFLRLIEKA